MPPRRTPAKKPVPVEPENRTPSEVVAFEIITRYADLTPSVNRIMQAELSEDGRLHAITLFRASLDSPGDPMRDPARAIAAAREVETPAG